MSITITSEKVVSGIFFRNPFYKKYFDVYGSGFDDRSDLRGSVTDVVEKKGFYGILHGILNTKKQIAHLQKWLSENDDVAGYKLNSVRNPFYFKREVRTLSHVSENFTIMSKGFNYIDERGGGGCIKETTTIHLTFGKTRKKILSGRSDVNNGYNLTYRHRVADFLKTGHLSN